MITSIQYDTHILFESSRFQENKANVCCPIFFVQVRAKIHLGGLDVHGMDIRPKFVYLFSRIFRKCRINTCQLEIHSSST